MTKKVDVNVEKLPSLRLTNRVRKNLVLEIMKHSKTQKSYDEAKSKMYAVAEQLRVSLLGGVEGVREIEAAVKDIQAEIDTRLSKVAKRNLSLTDILRYDNCISIPHDCGWQKTVIALNGVKIVPYVAREGDLTKAQARLAMRHQEHDAKIRQLRKEMTSLQCDVDETLAAFTNSKQVFAHWPEITKEMLKIMRQENVATPSKQLPTVQITKLNEAIGLPTDAQKGAKS